MFNILIHFALILAGWKHNKKTLLYSKSFGANISYKLFRANAVVQESNWRYARAKERETVRKTLEGKK
jgi:hypothetical protein